MRTLRLQAARALSGAFSTPGIMIVNISGGLDDYVSARRAFVDGQMFEPCDDENRGSFITRVTALAGQSQTRIALFGGLPPLPGSEDTHTVQSARPEIKDWWGDNPDDVGPDRRDVLSLLPEPVRPPPLDMSSRPPPGSAPLEVDE